MMDFAEAKTLVYNLINAQLEGFRSAHPSIDFLLRKRESRSIGQHNSGSFKRIQQKMAL